MVTPITLRPDDDFEESFEEKPEAVPGYEWMPDGAGGWTLLTLEEIDEGNGRAAKREKLADLRVEEEMEADLDPYYGDEDLE